MSMVALNSSAAARIGQLVRMLSSDQPGEVVNAARAINTALKRYGSDIHHLADVAERGLQLLPAPAAKPAPAPPPPRHDDIGDVIRFCYRRVDMLDDREHVFIANMNRKAWQSTAFAPSEKQRDWIYSIYEKVRTCP